MLKWLRKLLLLCLCMFSTGCATPPAYWKVHGESFATFPLPARRIYLLASMDSAFGVNVARPLSAKLRGALEENGAVVQSEMQTLNPVALEPDLNISGVRRFAPNAILLVRIRNASNYPGTYQQWDVAFDLLDDTFKGLWRGRTRILRTNAIEQSSEALAHEVVDDLREKHVLTLTGVAP